jgi:hypothetical protein
MIFHFLLLAFGTLEQLIDRSQAQLSRARYSNSELRVRPLRSRGPRGPIAEEKRRLGVANEMGQMEATFLDIENSELIATSCPFCDAHTVSASERNGRGSCATYRLAVRVERLFMDWCNDKFAIGTRCCEGCDGHENRKIKLAYEDPEMILAEIKCQSTSKDCHSLTCSTKGGIQCSTS